MLLKKIVVAEDDDAIAHMVGMALGDAGFLCLRARDGEEALRLVKQHDPDLLVLDVMMPRLDGLEVARRLKGDVMWSRIPILMLTALATVDHQVAGLDAGADAYMGKPFDLREFGARVRAMVRSARRERDRNPTSHLPGSRAIDQAIEDALLREKKDGVPSTVVHIDVLNFDGYADAVGIVHSELVVRGIGTLLLDVARRAAGDGGFVGHIGGSDFVVVIPGTAAAAFCDAALADFESKRDALLPDSANHALHLVLASAVTSALSAGSPTDAADELGRRLGKAMKAAKAAAKSNHVAWVPPATPAR
jgi:DNA-binding response OmpR family regulator